MYTWPKGYRQLLSDEEYDDGYSYYHENRKIYCIVCHEQIGGGEENAMYVDEKGPLCDSCFTDECDARNQEGFLNFS